MDSSEHWDRVIVHVDLDAFYASVEQLDDPGLAGRPVIVGGTGDRGVVAAASYEARRSGVRSAMPTREARQRCPDAVFLRPRMDRYKSVSREVFEIFRRFSPTVEGLSLDEAFLDVSGARLAARPRHLGRMLKSGVREATGLTASVGIAPNKLVAKIASDLEKPDGLVVIPPTELESRLADLPVRRLWGVGPETGSRLARLGIGTMGELAEAPDADLRRVFGRNHMRMRERARGVDHRPVSDDRTEVSISAEETYDRDLDDARELHEALRPLAERVTDRLRRSGLEAGTVGIKIRDAAFTTRSRQTRPGSPVFEFRALETAATGLLDAWLHENPGTAVRLLGVRVSDLREARQLGLFGDGDRLADAVDDVRGRFGAAALHRGRPRG